MYKSTLSSKWFKDNIKEFEKDPKFKAEYALLDVMNKICERHGQPKGIYKILFYLMEWCAQRLIWKKQV